MGSNDGNESRYAIYKYLIHLFFFPNRLPHLLFFFILLPSSILMSSRHCLDRLDGLCQRRTQSSSSPIEKRLTTTMNFVEEPVPESSNNLQSKKKKVRWADIEENALHLHKKAGTSSSPHNRTFMIIPSCFSFQWVLSSVKPKQIGDE